MMTRNRTDFRHRSRSSGFTLIELVVVITILAILSAAALPRFVSLQQDARIAKLDGIAGSLRAAAALAHAACLSQTGTGSIATGDSCRADNGVALVHSLMEGADIFLRNQYPTATDVGIDRAANIDLLGNKLTADIAPAAAGGGPSGRIFKVDGAANPDQCAVTYVEAVSAGGKITIPATVLVESRGC
jgi:MSHA pilin protein MshA